MVDIQNIETLKSFAPKRVKKYLFVWCSSGEFTVLVDQKLLRLVQNQVLTITSGQYHCFSNMKNAKGFVLDFTLDYICKTEKDIELIFQNSLFCHFDYNEIIIIDDSVAIESGLQKIQQELIERPFQYLESIHARIELLLVETNRSKLAHGGVVWKPDALFLRFLELVRNNFDKNYTLSQIADQLQTTELKLNELAKLHAGKTAQGVIHGLVVSEAQRILQYEDKRMKEVAFALGFQDPYYFSKFFKNHVGMPPTEYLKNLKN